MKEKFLESLKEALTTYSYSTNIPLVLLDENGSSVYSIGNEEPFLQIFQRVYRRYEPLFSNSYICS